MNSCAIPAELSQFPRIFVTTSYLNREWLLAHQDWRKKVRKPHESPPIRKKSIRGDSGNSWPVWNRGIKEHSGSVVECLIRDLKATGSSLTLVTALCPRIRHINPSLVLVQPRKTRPYKTDRLLMGHNKSNKSICNDKILTFLKWF